MAAKTIKDFKELKSLKKTLTKRQRQQKIRETREEANLREAEALFDKSKLNPNLEAEQEASDAPEETPTKEEQGKIDLRLALSKMHGAFSAFHARKESSLKLNLAAAAKLLPASLRGECMALFNIATHALKVNTQPVIDKAADEFNRVILSIIEETNTTDVTTLPTVDLPSRLSKTSIHSAAIYVFMDFPYDEKLVASEGFKSIQGNLFLNPKARVIGIPDTVKDHASALKRISIKGMSPQPVPLSRPGSFVKWYLATDKPVPIASLGFADRLGTKTVTSITYDDLNEEADSAVVRALIQNEEAMRKAKLMILASQREAFEVSNKDVLDRLEALENKMSALHREFIPLRDEMVKLTGKPFSTINRQEVKSATHLMYKERMRGIRQVDEMASMMQEELEETNKFLDMFDEAIAIRDKERELRKKRAALEETVERRKMAFIGKI